MTRRPSFRILRVGIGAVLAGGMIGVVTAGLGEGSASAEPPPVPAGATVVNNGSYANQADLPSACSSPAFTTIDSAVAAASSSETIYVCAGTYDENPTISLPLTLDGAEYGVDGVGRTGNPETVIDSTGGITYATGATTGTVSGFDLSGYTGTGPGEIQADPGLAGVGSGWTFTDNIIDVSNGGIGLNTDNVNDPAPTTIADNEFTQSTPAASESGSGWYGQAVTIWGDPGDNVTINNNDFDNLSGPGAAINTSGTGSCNGVGSGSSQNLSIGANTFEDNGGSGVDENFVALFCTTDASITNNTLKITDANDANAESPVYLGGGDISTTVSGNTETGDGAPDAAGVEFNAAFYPTDNASVENNSITGFNWGVLTYGGYGAPGVDPNPAPSGFAIEDNTIASSGTDGIEILDDGASPSNYPSNGTITGNDVSGSGTYDCQDQSTGGSGTDSTQNTWSEDIGATSSPSSPTALCNPATAPSVTTQPQSQYYNSGQSLTFTAAASGNPTPTVQWQYSTNGGSSWSNLSGATSTTLTVGPLTNFENGWEVRAVFTNSVSSATSNAATMTLATAPAVTTQPVSQYYNSGQSLTFTAAASGNPTPTVQWQYSTNGGSSWSNLSGATSTTLTVGPLTNFENHWEVRAVFTNSASSATSNAATMTLATAPVVTTQPRSQTYTTNQSLTFTAAASGSPTPTVQWQYSTNDGSSWSNLSGATSTTYTTGPLTNFENDWRFGPCSPTRPARPRATPPP